MIRSVQASFFGLCFLLVACPASDDASPGAPPGGSGGKGGAPAASGGAGGVAAAGGSGGTVAPPSTNGGSGGGGSAGSGGGGGGSPGTASGGSGGAAIDARDTGSTQDAPAGDLGGGEVRPGILGEGADYPGRPEVRICNKEWTHEQCCEFLCRCLNEICSDAPKAKNGIPTCGTWCPKLSNMAMRCHVYHCFESVSTGGKKDHDSHCGHAADQVPGGMCRNFVYE